ncbi:MAG TPA: PD-(D/E)XK nuclease family protein [Actinoplanes sp.]|nr:PD-(D/E)XK nuclease family protein [Actinoplanes sp.]
MSELISGSMIDHWLRCQRLYHYQHDRMIAPKETDWPLAVGRAGHGVLSAYYEALAISGNHREAREAALEMAGWRADVLGHDQKALAYVLPLIEYYWAVNAEDVLRWRIVEVEAEHRAPRAGWTLVGTSDLVVVDLATGDRVVIDHRFLMEFYTRAQARLDPQPVRYALLLRAAGQPVTHILRNMISTKPVSALPNAAKSERVKRIPLELTERRAETVNRETERAAQQIVAWRSLPIEVRRATAARTVIPGVRYPSCKTCPYAELCEAEAWGEDETAAQIQATKFGPTDYGYQEA